MRDFEDQFCYLTTVGRRTGRSHRIEIWFGQRGTTFYMLAGGGRRADWVRNLIANPAVGFEVGGEAHRATARVVEDAAEEALARALLAAKYQGWREGSPMSDWAQNALPVAVDVEDDVES